MLSKNIGASQPDTSNEIAGIKRELAEIKELAEQRRLLLFEKDLDLLEAQEQNVELQNQTVVKSLTIEEHEGLMLEVSGDYPVRCISINIIDRCFKVCQAW